MTFLNCVGITLLLASLACEQNKGKHESPTRQAATARRVTPLVAETSWVRGGRKDDHILAYPEYLAHDSSQVYVNDMAAKQIVAFDQRTGATNWNTAGTRSGLPAPGSIAGLPGGGVAVLDASGALVRIDRHGRLMTSAPLIEGQMARQICALSDSTFLIAYLRQRLPLVIVDAAGQTRKRFELPWVNLRELAPIQTQMILAGGPANRCIVSLVFGQGLAAMSKDSVEWIAPYIEPVAIPRVDSRTASRGNEQTTVAQIGARHVAVRDISVDNDVIEVIFEGVERKQGTLIDEYDVRTGAYRRTRSVGRRVVGIQKSGERAFLLVGLQGYPALVAMPMREEPK